MTAVNISTFEGPSLYAKHALVRLRVEAESWPKLPSEVLREQMAERLPRSTEWQAVHDVLEGLLAGGETTASLDLLAAVTCELQQEPFGIDLHWWTQESAFPGKIDILVAVGDPDIGAAAALFASQIARRFLPNEDSGSDDQLRASLSAAMQRFQRRRSEVGYGENQRLLLEAARARGIPGRKLVRGQRFVLLGHGKHRVRMGQNAGDRTSAFASRLSNNKHLTCRALLRAGIPAPRQRPIDSDEDVAKAVADIGYPLVVKGTTGSKGRSVTANIQDESELDAALTKARRFGGSPIIEEQIPGTDYRLLVVDGKLVAAARRRAAQITGDGHQSVQDLVGEENRRRAARGGYALWLVPLALDEDSLAILARQGLTPESVPRSGQEIRLRSAGNISQGGLPEDVTEEVHNDTVAIAIRAARVVGLDIAGVDVLTTDIARPLADTGGKIIEINHFPSLRPHYACETPARDAAGAIMDYLFPAPVRGRIPLIAVTGTNGKTTTCRLLQTVLIEAGYCTGLTTTSGSFVDKERILKGDYANTVGAHSVLQDPRVEAAVLETSRGGIIRKGFGWDSCDVAAVTNIRYDHVGEQGLHSVEELAQAKGTIVELARKAVVLNADDRYCRAMAERASAPVWWVSSRTEDGVIEQHLSKGGNAVVLEGEGGEERLVHRFGAAAKEIVRVSEMPCSLNGLVRHNVENAMTTAAAALAIGLSLEILRKALTGFTLSFEDSQGRLNMRDVGGTRIVLDFAHNMDGVARMARIVARMPFPGRRICHIITWGFYRDEFLDKLAATAAPLFDRFVITEAFRQKNPRKHGEAAEMVGDGIVAAGVPSEAVTVEPDEIKSMDLALGLLCPGDLLLLLCDKHEEGWSKVQAFELDATKATARALAQAKQKPTLTTPA